MSGELVYPSSPPYRPQSPVDSVSHSSTPPPPLESLNSRNASPDYVSSGSSSSSHAVSLDPHHQSSPSWDPYPGNLQRSTAEVVIAGPVIPDDEDRDRQRLLTTVTGAHIVALAWKRDPLLTYGEILSYLQTLCAQYYEPPVPGVVPVPCVHAMPPRYRMEFTPDDDTDPSDLSRSPLNPWNFYQMATSFQLSEGGDILLSRVSGLPMCVRDSFRVFRAAFQHIKSSPNPDIAAVVQGPHDILIARIEELSGFSFLDARAYAAFLINGFPALDPVELGLLGADSWLKEFGNDD
ncbi:hypothetical protein V5O48_018386 [Marasmius crinis-equi]|uniref:Uncharacterized protein n=1 Tax=Marasmius crinis-equi TaxID=585013 RepID=A0ABR3ELG1_9AGAR